MFIFKVTNSSVESFGVPGDESVLISHDGLDVFEYQQL